VKLQTVLPGKKQAENKKTANTFIETALAEILTGKGIG